MHFQRYLLTGLITVFPVWLTWIVFSFVLGQLSSFGAPLGSAFLTLLDWLLPGPDWFQQQGWLMFILAVLLTIGFLYGLGLLTTLVLGRRALLAVDQWIERIPLVKPIYGGTKKLVAALQTKPQGAQRVVLLAFPHSGARTLGLVTRVLQADGVQPERAAVFVPTTPNPTGGYLLIVPVDELIQTELSVEQAMAFIISGGAVAPEGFLGIRDGGLH